MTDPTPNPLESRVLVLAPTGRDAPLIGSVLAKNGIDAAICGDLAALRREIAAGAGTILIAEEVIDPGRGAVVADLAAQPPWSDLPILLLTQHGADSPAARQAVTELGNVTLLERPIRVASLISGVRSALRARQRQYQIRSYITEVQNAAKTRALLAAIVECSDDAIVSKTLDGVITSWNTGAERIFEYSAEEAIGQPITLIIPPERHDEEDRILSRLRRGEPIHHYETERMAKSGRRIDVSVSVSPLRDDTGRVIGGSKVARDISARKRADAALKEADRRKDEFLATLAHELRNPLAPIRSSLEMLAFAKGGDQVVDSALGIMNRQVDHMVRLVDDLLEVSRITRGKVELRLEIVELSDVIASAVETSRPLIDEARHELIVKTARRGLLLEGDPVRLSQVFANLLNNAAKYTDEGGTIWLTVAEDDSNVAVAVRDTGTGIEPELLPRVFEMFAQAEHRESRAQAGLGIGLSLVRSLVEMHGGTVEATSAGVGRGSEFTVRLPLASRQRKSAPGSVRKPRSAPGSGVSVLVVDDNRDAADSLGALLRSLGAHSEVAYDGASALQILEGRRPHLVFLDIGMPQMDGHEVARRIRERPENRGLLLVALTGWGQETDRDRAYEAGFDRHIGKPAGVEDLRSLLLSLRGERVAERNSGESPSGGPAEPVARSSLLRRAWSRLR